MTRFTAVDFLILLIAGPFFLVQQRNQDTPSRRKDPLPAQANQEARADERPLAGADQAPKSAFPVVIEQHHAAPDNSDDPDLQFLKRMGVGTNGPSLIKFLERRSPIEIRPNDLQAFIRRLGSDSFAERKEMSQKLSGLGYAALGALRRAQDDADPEISRRAKGLCETIDDDSYWRSAAAVVRRLAKLKFPGALDSLIRFLPFAHVESVIEEIWYAADALALRDGKIEPSLLAALKDPDPLRRALAACILARLGDQRQRVAAASLLEDKDALVRLRTAQGLLASGNRDCVPTLIRLLHDTSIEISWQAEELLHNLAQNTGPKETIGAGSAEERLACRNEWEKWWAEIGSKDNSGSGLTIHCQPRLLLVVQKVGNIGISERHSLALYGSDGMARWMIGHLTNVSGIQLLNGERILLAEGSPLQSVVERDLQGEVIRRSPPLDGPMLNVRRLPNGKTVAASTRWLESWELSSQSAAFSVVTHITPERAQLYSCRATRDGKRVCIHQNDEKSTPLVSEYEIAQGNLIAKRSLNRPIERVFDLDLVPNGNLLLAHDCKLTEFDRNGKAIWELSEEKMVAFSAIRLRNGNTVIGGRLEGAIPGLLEAAPEGAPCWEIILDRDARLVREVCPLIAFGFHPSSKDIDTIPFRLAQLRSSSPITRQRAMLAFMRKPPHDREAVQAIIATFQDPNEKVTYFTPRVLEKSEPFCTSMLIEALKDPREKVRAGAASALGGSENVTSEAVLPALVRALKDDKAAVREAAAGSIGQFGTKAALAIPDLVHALGDQSRDAARNAAFSLGRVGPGDNEAVKALISVVAHKEPAFQVAAIQALAYMKKSAAPAVPTLVQAFNDANHIHCRKEIIATLGEIGAPAKSAIPQLVEKAKDPSLTLCVLEALAKLGPAAQEALPLMLETLRTNKDGPVRSAALNAVNSLGDAGKPALPVLLQLRNDDSDDDFRQELRRTIRRLEKRVKGGE